MALGVTMALPWLESLRVWGDEIQEQRKKQPSSHDAWRYLFAGCGFHRQEWWGKGAGASMELGKVLHPLNDFRDRMVFIRGLYNAEAH